MSKMNALVKRLPEKGLWLEQVEIPKPSFGEALVKIKRTAICGTDLHIYNWDEWSQRTIPVPMIIGHEWVGE
ncbi:MAG: alcohol dehydrogenase catalytic domain-containing protein, partial [Clostridia bacterium]|nr:alcohol dehydrogenase catalytic domain-containing protein [Clostridia bacterium]